MKVEKIMTANVGCCHSDDCLIKAAEIMRQKDCGVVPVIDEKNKIVGIITDRDICFAAIENQKISQIKISNIIGTKVIFCAAADKVEDALKTMRKHQLKRLPVVGKSGEIVGILSVSDILISAGKNKKLKKKVYATLEAIFQPRPIVLREVIE